MTAYTEFDHWSPVLGDYAARLSMVDAMGAEHFKIVIKATGKVWRETKQKAKR